MAIRQSRSTSVVQGACRSSAGHRPSPDLWRPSKGNDAIFSEGWLHHLRRPICVKSWQPFHKPKSVLPAARFFMKEPSLVPAEFPDNDLTADQVRRNFIALEELNLLDCVERNRRRISVHPAILARVAGLTNVCSGPPVPPNAEYGNPAESIHCGQSSRPSEPGRTRPKDVIEALRLVREFLGQFNSVQPDCDEPSLPEIGSLSSDTTFTQAATSGRRTTSVC